MRPGAEGFVGSHRVRLGQLLIDAKLLDAPGLEAALVEQKRHGGKLGEVLIRLGRVSEPQLVEALAAQLGLPVARPELLQRASPEVLARVPARLAHELSVLPLELVEADRVLAVATAEELRGLRLERLREASGCWIVPRLCGPNALAAALVRHYGPPPPAVSEPVPAKSPEPARRLEALVQLLIEKGLVSDEELRRKTSEVSS